MVHVQVPLEEVPLASVSVLLEEVQVVQHVPGRVVEVELQFLVVVVEQEVQVVQVVQNVVLGQLVEVGRGFVLWWYFGCFQRRVPHRCLGSLCFC